MFSIMLAIVAVWSILFTMFHGGMAVKTIVNGEFKKWGWNCGMGFMFFVVALDSVLRIFSPAHTGLW